MNAATTSKALRAATLAAAFGALSACSGSPDGAASTAGGCAPSGELNYVCGPVNAEDIVQIGDSQWLILSGMSGDNTSGHLYLLDHNTKSYEEWFPGSNPAFALDESLFAECPGPLDTTNFSAHGLSLRERMDGEYRLYMTSHGEREAIEIFDIDTTAEKPAITWVGCVKLTEDISANSVAILADGGFVTTKFLDNNDPNARDLLAAGQITGAVYEWHPGVIGGLIAIEGTELSGPNGIELSADQRYMYVAALGAHEVVRFDRYTAPPAKESVSIGVRPDNLRWSADGRLFTVGGNYIPPEECQSPPCSTGWSVVAIDPTALEAERITGVDENATLQGASTALPVGNEIWIGTFRGDRVGYLPLP